MQREARDQRYQDISQRCGRKNISQIRPGKSGHVEDDEGEKEKNSERDPRVEHCGDHTLQVIRGNSSDLLHPVRKHGVTGRCKNGDSSQHKILANGHKFIVIPSFIILTEIIPSDVRMQAAP